MSTTAKVIDIDELETALATAASGDVIEILATLKSYVVTKPLIVPARVTLTGVTPALGATPETPTEMPGIPWPTGFTPYTQPKLEADPTLIGDILTLRDAAKLKGLTISDIAGREGNLVVVSSTAADDRVSASVEECELINPNPPSIRQSGPIGRGVVIVTRNPLGVSPPAPHEGAMISLRLHRTIIRSTDNGSGVFAINFAPRARIALDLSYNLIGGGLDAAGGVSRPFPVVGSETFIYSYANIYRSDGPTPALLGWSLHGGTNPPVPAFMPPFTNGNTLIMISEGDNIDGFEIAVNAVAGARPFDIAGPVNQNHASLHLNKLTITGASYDFVLVGAQAGDGTGPPTFAPGDDNHLLVTIDGSCKTGGGSSLYSHAADLDGGDLADSGSGNRVEVMLRKVVAGLTQPPADVMIF